MAGDTLIVGFGGLGLYIPAGGSKEGYNRKDNDFAGCTALFSQHVFHGKLGATGQRISILLLRAGEDVKAKRARFVKNDYKRYRFTPNR
jgi:hypothetical protein